MQTVLIVVGCLVAAVVLVFVLLVVRTILCGRRVRGRVWRLVGPVLWRLEKGEAVSADELAALAERLETRSMLYRSLHRMELGELFPEAHRGLECIAASDLAVWLMHPNELGAVPDEMVCVRSVEREEDGRPYRFFLFKYRSRPPHWAAKKGWLAGLAGPYWEGEVSQVSPPGVFSRFEAFDSRSEDEHVETIQATVVRAFKGNVGLARTRVE